MASQQILIPAEDKNWKAPEAPVTPMSLMQIALANGQAEQLQIIQEMYFRDQERKAEIAFNQAMNTAQSEIGRIAPDAYNQETKSKWATYPKMDKELRPIYVKNGFSLSFDTADAPGPEMVRAVCYVSHREGHTRRYQADVPYADKGPKGGNVMTKTHGSGAAMSYAQRYLLKYIFNIAIGEDDNDGNSLESGPELKGLDEYLMAIRDAHSYEDMDRSFKEAFAAASEIKAEKAKDALAKARDDWRKKKRGPQ